MAKLLFSTDDSACVEFPDERIVVFVKPYDKAQLVEMLKDRIKKSSQKEVAEEFGLSTAFISDVIHGRRQMTTNLAEKMGFAAVFQKVE